MLSSSCPCRPPHAQTSTPVRRRSSSRGRRGPRDAPRRATADRAKTQPNPSQTKPTAPYRVHGTLANPSNRRGKINLSAARIVESVTDRTKINTSRRIEFRVTIGGRYIAAVCSVECAEYHTSSPNQRMPCDPNRGIPARRPSPRRGLARPVPVRLSGPRRSRAVVSAHDVTPRRLRDRPPRERPLDSGSPMAENLKLKLLNTVARRSPRLTQRCSEQRE